jgi:hypothetical protein
MRQLQTPALQWDKREMGVVELAKGGEVVYARDCATDSELTQSDVIIRYEGDEVNSLTFCRAANGNHFANIQGIGFFSWGTLRSW